MAEQYLFNALNASRTVAGLPPLTWSERLSVAAAQHAESMWASDVITHQLEQEKDLPERAAANGVRFSVVAENVGVAPSPVELHTEWLQSAGHRENMLDPSVNLVGIAVRGDGEEFWGVEDFAGSIGDLSIGEQEARIRKLLLLAGLRSSSTAAARTMCRQASGFSGARPAFVMRFTSTDLSRLPEQLLDRVRQGNVSQGAVGACEYPRETFSSYSIAVALYR